MAIDLRFKHVLRDDGLNPKLISTDNLDLK